MKTFKIITFGCRVNQAESRQMGEKLIQVEKVEEVDKSRKADLVVINSCCVTNKAEREVRKEIRRVKKENPGCFLIVTGCWVERIKNQDLRIKNLIDLLVLNKDKEKIGRILKRVLELESFRVSGNKKIYKDKYAKSKKAIVKIQEGCDNFCTYCLVPYVRGRSKSRSAEEIIEEIKRLIKEGIEAVVLTGIDIASYEPSLVQLIKVILAETKIKKISFGSMGLKIFEKEFIGLYKSLNINKKSALTNRRPWLDKSRLSSHFHIPLQSGCEATLKRMKRKYTGEKFIDVIEKLKKEIPGFSFSTDVIVGFPGETKKEFNQTMKTLETIRTILGRQFAKIHVFRYSPREGTVAAKMRGKRGWERVAEKEKKRRANEVLRRLHF